MNLFPGHVPAAIPLTVCLDSVRRRATNHTHTVEHA
jgi:hypothetical protein